MNEHNVKKTFANFWHFRFDFFFFQICLIEIWKSCLNDVLIVISNKWLKYDVYLIITSNFYWFRWNYKETNLLEIFLKKILSKMILTYVSIENLNSQLMKTSNLTKKILICETNLTNFKTSILSNFITNSILLELMRLLIRWNAFE